MENNIYDHYIAMDWSLKIMAIARMTKKSNKITVFEAPADVLEFQIYLQSLKGTKVLAIEETTTSQWLYTELKDEVDQLVICDPHRNHLLNEGVKTDKVDASKLVQLLKAGLLKEVYHSGDKFLYLRRLVSGYEDLVKSGVRLKNQRYALLRACGGTGKEKEATHFQGPQDQYVLKCLARQIDLYEEEKEGYEKQFGILARKYPEIRHQESLPGIGLIHAIKVVSRVVTPHRFADRGQYLSYCGLVKLEKTSGQTSYGWRSSRYSRQLKCVYKMGVLAALNQSNPIKNYYEHLIRDKNYPEYQARHKACRRLAILSLGVFKSGKKYQIGRIPIEKRQELSSDL